MHVRLFSSKLMMLSAPLERIGLISVPLLQDGGDVMTRRAPRLVPLP